MIINAESLRAAADAGEIGPIHYNPRTSRAIEIQPGVSMALSKDTIACERALLIWQATEVRSDVTCKDCLAIMERQS